MKYLISTEFVREHGSTIAQGVQFFNFLTFCGAEHVQFIKCIYYISLDVFCGSIDEVEEIKIVSGDFLIRGWRVEVADFTDDDVKFWLVRFRYYFD